MYLRDNDTLDSHMPLLLLIPAIFPVLHIGVPACLFRFQCLIDRTVVLTTHHETQFDYRYLEWD